MVCSHCGGRIPRARGFAQSVGRGSPLPPLVRPRLRLPRTTTPLASASLPRATRSRRTRPRLISFHLQELPPVRIPHRRSAAFSPPARRSGRGTTSSGARRGRHGGGLPGLGRGAGGRGRAEGDPARGGRGSELPRAISSGASSASCCWRARSRTGTSSASTIWARSDGIKYITMPYIQGIDLGRACCA